MSLIRISCPVCDIWFEVPNQKEIICCPNCQIKWSPMFRCHCGTLLEMPDQGRRTIQCPNCQKKRHVPNKAMRSLERRRLINERDEQLAGEAVERLIYERADQLPCELVDGTTFVPNYPLWFVVAKGVFQFGDIQSGQVAGGVTEFGETYAAIFTDESLAKQFAKHSHPDDDPTIGWIADEGVFRQFLRQIKEIGPGCLALLNTTGLSTKCKLIKVRDVLDDLDKQQPNEHIILKADDRKKNI